MKQTTDLAKVKDKAILFVYLEPKPKPSVDFLIDYPFLDTMFGVLKSNGKMFNVYNDKDDFELFRVEMIERIQSTKTVMDILVLMCKPYWLTFFKHIQGYLDAKDFTEILKDIWIDTEFPMLNLDVTTQELTAWFSFCDKDILMSKEDSSYLDSLSDVVTVYRGVSSDEYKNGFSWTLSKEKAEWFATRLEFDGCSPVLYSFDVNKSDIVAYLSCRGEAEIIIPPETLTNYKINCLYL